MSISTLLIDAFRITHPEQEGRQIKVVDVLDRAAEHLVKAFDGPPTAKAALLRALGRTFLSLALDDKAAVLLAKSLAVNEAKLGPNHPSTLRIRANLADAYNAAGRTRDAAKLCEATLKVQETTLGPDHPDTLTTRINLADAYLSTGGTAGRGEAVQGCTQGLGVELRVRSPERDLLQHPTRLRLRVPRPLGLGPWVTARRDWSGRLGRRAVFSSPRLLPAAPTPA